MMMRPTSLALVCGIAVFSLIASAQGGRSREWLTWGGDQERTGWNRGETALSKQTVGRLGLKWKTQIDKEVSIEIESGNSMLTAPLVAQGVRTPQGQKTVVYTLAASNTLAALDAATGRTDLAPDVRQHSRTAKRCQLDLYQHLYCHSGHRQGQGHPLYARSRWSSARRRFRQRRGEADSAAGVCDAIFAQLESQPRRWRPLHDGRSWMRQRSSTWRARTASPAQSAAVAPLAPRRRRLPRT